MSSGRDDSFLYAGARSNPDRVARKEELLNQRNQQRTELAPQATVVFEKIADQEKMLGELLLGIVDDTTPDDDVRVKLTAVRLHRTWLQQIRMELSNILRLTPDEKKRLDAEAKKTSFEEDGDE